MKGIPSLPMLQLTYMQSLAFFKKHYTFSNSLNFKNHGLCPDHATFACCLKACSSLADDVNGKTIHSEVIVKGVEMIKTVGTALINMYIKCGLLDDARQIFDGMPDQNVALWTALILAYTEQGSGHDALECVERMQLQSVSPDESMFVCSLKACISIDCVNKGRELHSEIVEKGFERNPFVSDTLVDMYMKFRHLRDARHTFEQLQSRTVVSWNVLLTGYIDNGYNEEALMCLKHMHSVGILPDEITFACSLKAFGNLKSALQARGIHSRICKEGFDKNIVVANALLDVYSRIGSLLEAQKLFDQHPVQNLGAWNTLLTCFVEHECSGEALNIFKQMKSKHLYRDKITYVCCLKACGQSKLLEEGAQIHIDIVKEGLDIELSVANSVVDFYARCACLTEAVQLFEKLPVKNIILWSSMVAGFAEHEHDHEALQIFKKMQADGVSPTDITYISTLKACGNLGALVQGQEVHTEIVIMSLHNVMHYSSMIEAGASCRNYSTLVPLENALIHMYGKCGSMLNADAICDTISIINEAGWNVLIAGHARKGDTRLVLELFDRMKYLGIQPDWSTFLSVLTACSHEGLVNEGENYFHGMEEYKIEPRIEHYNCMIHLFSRAGRFKEVLQLLEKLPHEPNLDTWCSLLGSCSKWCNKELGIFAFDSALKLDKTHSAMFITMSNIYAGS